MSQRSRLVISNFLSLPSVFVVFSRLDLFYTTSTQRNLYVSRLFLVSLVLWIDKHWGNTLREKLHETVRLRYINRGRSGASTPISLSELFYNILNSAEYSECMKCVLMYSMGLTFVWVITYEILVYSGFNREFTWGTAEVYASWIGVVLQRWLAHWAESFWAVPP